MKNRKIVTILASAAMAASFSMPSFARAHPACTAAPPTAASYTWDFKQEANNLMQEVRGDAVRAQQQAATLQSFADNQTLGWQEHGFYLSQLRDEVNDMGAKMCRLETIRGSVAPWQQAAIDKMQIEIQLMAMHAQKAIHFGNNNREDLFSPRYQAHIDNLYQEARTLSRTLGDAINFAHVQKHYRNLRQDLGVHAAS